MRTIQIIKADRYILLFFFRNGNRDQMSLCIFIFLVIRIIIVCSVQWRIENRFPLRLTFILYLHTQSPIISGSSFYKFDLRNRLQSRNFDSRIILFFCPNITGSHIRTGKFRICSCRRNNYLRQRKRKILVRKMSLCRYNDCIIACRRRFPILKCRRIQKFLFCTDRTDHRQT